MFNRVDVRIGSSPSSSLGLLFLSLGVPGISILIWFSAFYTGDDRNTLFPVARHSIEATLRYYIRPLEYAVVQLSNMIYLPLWILFSLVFAVTAAYVSVRTAEIITEKKFSSSVRPLIISANPLWFYAISQVDTVSQSLCNLAFAIGLFFLVRLIKETTRSKANQFGLLINITSTLILFTKELAIPAALTLVSIAAWHQLRYRRANFSYFLSCGIFISGLLLWIAIKFRFGGMLPEAGGHYNTTPSLLDIVRNTAAIFSFSLTPLPSSFLSFSLLANVWAATGVAMTLLFFVTLRKLKWSAHAGYTVLAVLGACFPMFYIHASELYASMVSSFLIAMFILLLAPREAIIWLYGIALLCCSYLNCFIYYQAESSFVAVLGARQSYSVYSGPNGLFNGGIPVKTFCAVRSAREVSWVDGQLVCF